jgi:hypothetical protein
MCCGQANNSSFVMPLFFKLSVLSHPQVSLSERLANRGNGESTLRQAQDWTFGTSLAHVGTSGTHWQPPNGAKATSHRVLTVWSFSASTSSGRPGLSATGRGKAACLAVQQSPDGLLVR